MVLLDEELLDLISDNWAPRGRASFVRYDQKAPRIEKAMEQAQLPVTATPDKIICLVNELLAKLGMHKAKGVKVPFEEGASNRRLFALLRGGIYQQVADSCADKRDLVWMKFTVDGYLGVIAASNDINFNIPPKNAEDLKKYHTSGIIIWRLRKEWDRRFVLVFPLLGIPEGYTRHDIEIAIGNHLIQQRIPILDYYSHRY